MTKAEMMVIIEEGKIEGMRQEIGWLKRNSCIERNAERKIQRIEELIRQEQGILRKWQKALGKEI